MRRVFVLCSLLALAACAQPAPPPPPPPPPPPAPVEHTFTLFFDWDRANITPDAQQIIEAAAATFKSEPSGATVQVTGHTDTTGSAAYNQKLSERRAEAVANALVQAGLPRSVMTVTGVGMSDLKVQTPPGVREPQNRRVEIVEGAAPAAPPPAPPPSSAPPATQ
jgi:OmpA-OmpF porin, OOP family